MIAFFVYNLNKYSGAAQQASLLANHLGLPVVIFNHERGVSFSRLKINAAVDVINLPRSKPLALVALFFYMALFRVKVIHLHGFFKHGLFLGRVLRKRVILKTTLMDSDDFLSLYRKAPNKLVFNFLLRCIDINICLTRQLRERNTKFVDEAKVRVIPNAVLTDGSYSTEKDNIFCFVGLVCNRKGTYESIEYYLKNYVKLPGSKLYVVGPLSGVDEVDSKYVKKCQDLVASYNASANVVFTGNVSKNDVVSFFKESKALLFFSKNEGMPNVVLEAMANNCLPITTGLDGVVNDMLGPDLSSSLVLSNHAEVVSIEKIDEIIASGQIVNQSKMFFSIDAVGSAYRALYMELVS